MKPSYFSLLNKSLQNFKNNPVVFLPLLLGILFSLAFFVIGGIEVLFLMSFFDLFKDKTPFSVGMIFFIVLFIVIDILLLIVIRVYVTSMLIGLLKSISIRGKTSVQEMWESGRKYFKSYFFYILLVSLITFLPFALISLIGALFFISSKPVGVVIFFTLFMVFIIYSIFVRLCLFFAEPMIVSEKMGALDIIRKSVRYLFKKPEHVLITWGISIVLALVVVSVVTLITLPMQLAGAIMAPVVAGAVSLRVIVNIILRLYLGIFKFNSYFEFNPEKKH